MSVVSVSAQDLLLSMPPLEVKDFASVQSDLTKLVALTKKETIDKNAVAKEMQTRTCLQDENSTDAFSVALAKCWSAHQEETYGKKDGVTARFTVLQQDDGWMLRTYAEVLDTAKFRTGYWAGKWMIMGGNGGGGSSKKVAISGELSLHVYYYEGGSNVQMRGKREIPAASVNTSSGNGDDDNETKMAKAIVEYIKSMEKSLHQDLSNDDALFLSSLPKIRRILPITKTRMKWNDAAQNQVRLLNARSSSSSKN